MRKEYAFYRFLLIFSLILVIVSSTIQAAEEYLDIDVVDVSFGETRGVEPSPFHLSHDLTSGDYFISIKTLNHQNGTQFGTNFKLALPPDDIMPAAILWSEFFGPGLARGVEPSPFIIMRDYTMYYFPLTHEPDGSPLMVGAWESIGVFLPTTYGDANCATELPGSEFPDGLPRLYVGTEDGYIFWLVENVGVGGVIVEGAFTYSGGPIIDLEPIPQFGYIALGALMDNAIYGFNPGTKKGSSENRYMYNFRLYDTRPEPMTDFDVIGNKHEPLTDPADMAKIVIANGTDDLGLATLLADEGGDVELTITPDKMDQNIGKIATNALLFLPNDGSMVLFDPHFNNDEGSSGCAIDITVPPEPCHNICGDVDNNGLVNILDGVFLINYKYREGPEPYIFRLGDIDNNSQIDILDVIYLINFKYKEGPDPNCP